MKPVSAPGIVRSLVRAPGLGSAALACSLLLAAPVTAGALQAAGHRPVTAQFADGSPLPGPHDLADGNPPASPYTPHSAAADGSPLPAPH